jgi:predicted DNA-binding protein
MEPVGDAVIYVRIPAETADKLAAVAQSKRRSTADFVRSLIAKAIK